MIYIINSAIGYKQKLRVNPKNSHHMEKFKNLLMFRHAVMGVHLMYCDNHFMMYISEIIMLGTLNVYRDVCQFYLNKTGRKNGKKIIK